MSELMSHFMYGDFEMCEKCAQLRVQLAGCSTAALGCISPEQLAKPGDYGWSPAYEDVVKLRRMYDQLMTELCRIYQLSLGILAEEKNW